MNLASRHSAIPVVGLLLALGLAPPGVGAQRAAVVHGTVTDTAGVPLAGARLVLLELRRATLADAEGRFRFAAVPSGTHALAVTRLGHAPEVRRIVVSGAELRVDVRLRVVGVPMSAIQVTATPGATLARESPQPTAVLEGPELRVSQGAALGETLELVPGVRSLSMTTGIGKPVIRGMTHYRVVTLDNGQRSETQAWGHDHSPNVETAAAERVEVIKGPASVLYGSDALGGVVNVVAPAVPDAIGQSPFVRGRLSTVYSHNTRGRDGTLALDAARGAVGVRGALTMRASSDMRTPDGRLSNTDNRAAASELAAGLRRGALSLQARYTGRDERIEIFDDPVASPGYTGYQRIRTDRASVELRAPVGASRLHVNVGWEENYRREFAHATAPEPDLGLHVANWTGFAHLDHVVGPSLSGTLGVSGMSSRFANRGTRTLIPSSETRNAAVYLFEQLARGPWRASVGARYDRRTLATDGDARIDVPTQSRAFDAVTGSVGLLRQLGDGVALVASMARGFRAPAAPDLFANGFHEGTRAFERGNPDLRVETSLNTDVGVRVSRAAVSAELTGFVNRIDGYIYLRPFGSGARAYDSLQVEQGDARLAGLEGRVAWRVVQPLTLQLSGDYVRGQNTTAAVPLTFIPPLRLVYGGRLEAPPASAGVPPAYLAFTFESNARQTRLDPRDMSPPGYTLATLGAGLTRLVPRGAASVDLTIRNLFDVRYRSF
ncbi:MAG TPA: TonB-dependent receptor, partial [Gemmatimonadaceae bacterium]|nr:TonB-dependent receptor [Gemmatimonadaceae bacterium]